MYESQPHPSQSLLSSRSSIRLLDNLIRALGLTMLDAGKPNANTFDVDAIPRQPVSQRGYHQSFSSSRTKMPYPPKIATVPVQPLGKAVPRLSSISPPIARFRLRCRDRPRRRGAVTATVFCCRKTLPSHMPSLRFGASHQIGHQNGRRRRSRRRKREGWYGPR
jgi:hypothetical protein